MISPEVPRHDFSNHRASEPVDATLLRDTTTTQVNGGASLVSTPSAAARVPATSPTPLTHDGVRSRGPSPQPAPGGRFLRDPRKSLNPASRASSQSPMRLSMPAISPGQLAFSAMLYHPVPTLVLNSLKTVVLANEALGRMLGIVDEDVDEENASLTLEHIRGQTLAQVGIDMLQDGRPVWVAWETMLDNLVDEMGVRASSDAAHQPNQYEGVTPTPNNVKPSHHVRQTSTSGNRPCKNAAMEVVVTRKELGNSVVDSLRSRPDSKDNQVFAKMLISIWELEDKQTYFTLTFTSTQSAPSALVPSKKSVVKPIILEAAEKKSITTPSIVLSNPSSVASSRGAGSPSFSIPSAITMSSNPFPPMGPPPAASQMSAPSVLQKMILMKDALLDNTQVPILAVWKDGSVTFPNKAARKLFRLEATNTDPTEDGFSILDRWDMWNEDFTERLSIDEYPISILMRTETPFTSIRVGIFDANGERVVFDCVGEVIRDEGTGEFLAGVITGRDCTSMSKEITEIKEKDEERFKLICDTMPQLVWTAKPDGTVDFFNTRWYAYTGLTPEVCLREGWLNHIHPDDMPETSSRWKHSLSTGEPFVTEYRCRSKDGEWRWFLARALAVRHKESDEIEKWFGTCTDVHESIETKLSAKRLRQQLLNVIAHSHVTIFTADAQRRVTMLEGAMIWDMNSEDNLENTRWFVGKNVYKVFNRLTEHVAKGVQLEFLQPIEDIINGYSDGIGVDEHQLNDRWYRTRFVPMHGKKTKEGKSTSETVVDGVIGVIMDVTELRLQKTQAEQRLKEKRKAVANEASAKEATRLKSQFLANMSHEIRTPITGVLGMAELLGGMELDEEQRDYVENIHSSATSLLTVINDILDFSKVESGRLDIEEVQFSLSVIVKEVVRMLKFAVQRKNLDFYSDIDGGIEQNLVVLGDPGRVRQIITNLLTNSIKFTNQGSVRFSVSKEKETADSIEIKFVVEDTGIGIQDEVRKKLFQPFSQGDASTARRFGGTGLGLTICKNLLDLMNGRIDLESRVGAGTTATFYIPFNKPQGRRDPDMAQAAAIPDRLQSDISLSCNSSDHELMASSSPLSDGIPLATHFPQRRPSTRTSPSPDQDLPRAERAKIHILVVEDNPVNQKIATKTISRLGFQVTATWNGKEALEYLLGSTEGVNPKPDLILMDVQMPVIDGYKCTHLLRHHKPYKSLLHDVPIVAMTASAIQGDREKCTRAGMDDYLSKPVTMSILERMLVRWCVAKRKPPGRHTTSTSDCSEQRENCDSADIPHVEIEDKGGKPLDDTPNSPITPRPLIMNGERELEQSPFDSPAAPELAPQAVGRRGEHDKEWSSQLQETKLIDAAGGGPTGLRSKSFQSQPGGEALTEENVKKLKRENVPPSQ